MADPQNTDAWQRALDLLDSDLKQSILARNVDKRDALASIRDVAEKKKKICLQKRWKFKKSNGEVIILRDIFEKIITWVDMFKVMGDGILPLDPIHTALPWAAIRFMLQACVNEKQYFEDTVQGLETVTRIISRYAIVEKIYLARQSEITPQLKTVLVDLYTEILSFLAEGTKYFEKPAAVRMLKGAFQATGNERLKKIHKFDEEMTKLTGTLDGQYHEELSVDIRQMKDIVEKFEHPINRLVDASAIYLKSLEIQRFSETRAWLSSIPYLQHHKRHSANRLPDSCRWLFEDAKFRSWESSSSSSILVLHGIPGSGKTALMSAVVDSFLEANKQNPSTAPLAYVYCGDSRGVATGMNSDEVMQSLVRQLGIVDATHCKVHECLALEYERREAEANLDGFDVPKLNSIECAKLILEITGSNPANIVIDALDEVEESQLYSLIEALRLIKEESASVVNILLSSRSNARIFELLSEQQMLAIKPSNNKQDMEYFVHQTLDLAITQKRLLMGDVSQELLAELRLALISGAGEMFLWVKLQVEELCRIPVEASITNYMRQQSATSLNKLYSQMFDGVSTTDRYSSEIAMVAFSWILCMHEPLSPPALLDAISMAFSDAPRRITLPQLLDLCSNLIVPDKELNVLRLVHSSFEAFLLAKPEFSPEKLHKIAAASCLNSCMTGPAYDISRRPSSSTKFAHYSMLYWGSHCRAALQELHEETLSQKMQEFVFADGLETSLPFFSWLESARMASERIPKDHKLKKDLDAVISTSMSPLFAVCVYGLLPLLKILEGSESLDWDQENCKGHTGLYLASATGQLETVRTLLGKNLNFNKICGTHGTPINVAANNGHHEVVKLLLESSHYSPTENDLKKVFQIACLADHENIAMLLLQHLPNDDQEYEENLQSAVSAGFHSAAQNLIERSAHLANNLSAKSKAVVTATEKGQIEFLQLFLRDAQALKSALPEDLVARAALHGHSEIVRFLLDQDFGIEEESVIGRPLQVASLMGHDRTVRLLIAQGAEIDANGTLGPALHTAAMKGNLCIVKTLLQEGANVQTGGGFYGTPLQAAAYRGHVQIVEILLKAGADMDARGRFTDVFHAASEGGQEPLIQYLLQNGYNPRVPMSWYRDIRYSLTVANIPLKRTKDASMSQKLSDAHFAEVLEVSRSKQNIKPVKKNENKYDRMLMYHVGYITEPKPWDETFHAMEYSLEYVAENGHTKSFQAMLQTMNFGSDDRSVGYALLAACKSGQNEIVEMILESELMDLRKYMKGGLIRAAWHGNLFVFDKLVETQGYFQEENPDMDDIGDEYDYCLPRNRSSEYMPSRTSLQDKYIENHDHYVSYGSSTKPGILCVLLAACRGGQLPIVMKVLNLARHNVPETEIRTLEAVSLREAAIYSHADVVDALNHAWIPFGPGFFSEIVHAACTLGDENTLRSLLSRENQDLLQEEDHRKNLEAIAANGRADFMRFYANALSTRINDLSSVSAIIIDAAGRGHVEVVDLVLSNFEAQAVENKVALNKALNAAASKAFVSIVEILIRNGADVNARVQPTVWDCGDKSSTQIVTASPWSRKEKHLADSCDTKPREPRTALQACVANLPTPGPNQLLPRSDVNLERELSHSVKARYERVIQILLNEGATINDINSCTISAFHEAVMKCQAETVQLMLQKGADVNMARSTYGTTIKCAVMRRNGAMHLIELLRRAGATLSPAEMLDAALNTKLERSLFDHMLKVEARDHPGELMKFLLQLNPEQKATDPRYDQLLLFAAKTGDNELVEVLVQRGVDVDRAKHSFLGDPLAVASSNGHVQVVRSLIAAGAMVNVKAITGAISGGKIDVLEILCLAAGDIQRLSSSQEHGYRELLYKERTPLQEAVYWKSDEAMRTLLKYKVDVVSIGPALMETIRNGSVSIARLLLDAGAKIEINKEGRFENTSRILEEACRTGNLELVDLIISEGKNVGYRFEQEGPKALSLACSLGFEDIARRFLMDASEELAKPLTKAATNGHVDVIELLLEFGASVNEVVEDGFPKTALSLAASKGHRDVVEKLLAAGASVYLCNETTNWKPKEVHDPRIPQSIRDAYMAPPNALKEAVLRRQWEITDVLLANLNDKPTSYDACMDALKSVSYGHRAKEFTKLVKLVPASATLLAKSCTVGSREAVETMLANGLEVNYSLQDNAQPLQLAAYHHHLEVVDLLINEGANIAHVSAKYGTAIQAALWQNDSEDGKYTHRGQKRGVWSPDSPPPPPDCRRCYPLGTPRGCRQTVSRLIRAGIDINPDYAEFGIPLQEACLAGYESIVRMLLDHGADVHATGGKRGTALLAALTGAKWRVVKLLLDQGAALNVTMPGYSNRFDFACWHLNEECLSETWRRDKVTIVRLLRNYCANRHIYLAPEIQEILAKDPPWPIVPENSNELE